MLRWDLLTPFPEQEPDERERGDACVEEIAALVEAGVDPDEVDRTCELPAGLFDDLRAGGFLTLPHEPALGGRGLSVYDTFRVVERACRWSVPVGQLLGVQNGVAPLALVPLLPPGPVLDLLRDRVAAGALAGWADTEPAGQNNAMPTLTGTLTADGSAYLLRGEKLFIGNATVAELLAVTGLVHEAGQPFVTVFFVDTRVPGLTIRAQEFMGSKGLPNGAVSFDGARVPAAHTLRVGGGTTNPQAAPLTRAATLVGRLYSMLGPGVAAARMSLVWTRQFVARRAIDGRALGEYDLIQRAVATSASEVFAMDSVLRWTLIGPGLADRWLELNFTLSAVRAAAWRVVDRTMSLLGGEGFETAASKRGRGAEPLPVERALRDARGIRVVGNVDFQVDNVNGRNLLARYYDDALSAGPTESADLGLATAYDADLSPANVGHLHAVAEQTKAFARASRRIVRRYPDPAELAGQEQILALTNRIATELFTVSAVLAHASHRAGTDAGESQMLADVFCTAARHRLADLWRQLEADPEPDYAKVSRGWLTDTSLDFLLDT
jgi:alkylation response protein AidB-like acyl-CoA dehydrogenase